jgi:hypothetical protein
MMERMIGHREAFARGDPALAALKTDLKSGRFRTQDDYTKFSGALMALTLNLFDSGRISSSVLSYIHDVDNKVQSANLTSA